MFGVKLFSRSLAGRMATAFPSVSSAVVDSNVSKTPDEMPTGDRPCKRKKVKSKSGEESRPKKVFKRVDRHGYGDDRFDETQYYFENGLRKVYPYFFTFSVFCKGRWVNRKLIDVFKNEFRAHPHQLFERSIKNGLITVNSECVSLDYVLKENDFIENKAHRHEVPVTDQKIAIVHQSDDLLVVNKPPSIPVHPCGRYRHNTMAFILGKEFGFKDIRTAHRLDRLTSGLLIFARTVEKDREIKTQISQRVVSKEYLCRVEGEFPNDPIICLEPIGLISEKVGISRVSADAPDSKACRTEFQKLSYNGKSSAVLCKPHTGRMHQIRVHLQYLGYPILNDPLYNHPAFGPNKGKNGDTGKTDEQLIEDLLKMHNAEAWLGTGSINDVASTNLLEEAVSSANTLAEKSKSETMNDAALEKMEKAPDEKKLCDPTYDALCPQCIGMINYRDPSPESLVMYLHAWKYRGPGWEFETEIPEWAKEDWTLD